MQQRTSRLGPFKGHLGLADLPPDPSASDDVDALVHGELRPTITVIDGGGDDLIPLGDDSKREAFPLSILPAWVAEHVSAVADDMQVPLDLTAMLAVGALSTVCAGSVTVTVKGGWREHVNLYTATALPPGAGKSPAYKQMIGPIEQMERDARARVEGDIAAAEQQKRLLKGKLDEVEKSVMKGSATDADAVEAERQFRELEVPARPKWILDDATPEVVVRTIAEQKGRIAFLSSEGGIFDQMAGRYSDKSKPNLDIYLKGFSADGYKVDRIGRGADDIEAAIITMAVTVQPSVIASLKDTPEFAGRGLVSRFMYSVPTDMVGERDYLGRLAIEDRSPQTGGVYAKKLQDLHSWVSGRKPELTLSPEALRAFFEFRQSIEDQRKPEGPLRHVAEWTEKMIASVIRVAGLLHLAQERGASDTIIPAETMRLAIRLGGYWLEHYKVVHGMWEITDELRLAQLILDWVQNKGLTSFSIRDCHRALQRKANRVDDLLPPLTVLCERGWLRTSDAEPPRKAGRGGLGGSQQSQLLEVTAAALREWAGSS